MRIKWIRLLLVLGLILALSACSPPKDTVPEADTAAQQSDQDNNQGDQAESNQDSENQDTEAAADDGESMDEVTTEEESAPEAPPIDVAQIYADNCAGCHGNKRQGGGGPSLLPERLTKDAPEYKKTISEGVSGTPMKAWKDKLSEEVITALSEWILTPVE